MLNLEKVNSLKNIIDIKKEKMSEDMKNGFIRSLNQNRLELLEKLYSFGNSNYSSEIVKELIGLYDKQNRLIKDFTKNGGFNENIECLGFYNDSKNVSFSINKFINQLRFVNGKEFPEEKERILEINKKINFSGLYSYDEESGIRELKIQESKISGNEYKKMIVLANSEFQQELSKMTEIKAGRMKDKDLNNLYEHGILKLFSNNETEIEDGIKAINTISGVQNSDIEEPSKNITPEPENPTSLKTIYDIMKKEKNTMWLKDNINTLNNQDKLNELELTEHPVLDFANEINDKQSDNYNQKESQKLMTNLFSDDRIKQNFDRNNIINYLKRDFPEPAIFKSMIDSLSKEEIQSPFDEKHLFVEKVISVLIGEESSCDHFNENKLACLVNLISCENFDINQKLNISTSKDLTGLMERKLTEQYKDLEHSPSLSKEKRVLNDSIPNQKNYVGKNKITIIDYLKKAQDHLMLQHQASDLENVNRYNEMFTKDGFLEQSVRKDWHDVLKYTIPNEDFGATKFKKKIADVATYVNSWNGPISCLFGFAGLMLLSVVMGVAKIQEKSQNDRIRDHVNSLSGDQKLLVDKIKTEVDERTGQVVVSAISDGETFQIGRGNSCKDLVEISPTLNTISTAKVNLFNHILPEINKIEGINLTNDDMKKELSDDIEKYLENHPISDETPSKSKDQVSGFGMA